MDSSFDYISIHSSASGLNFESIHFKFLFGIWILDFIGTEMATQRKMEEMTEMIVSVVPGICPRKKDAINLIFLSMSFAQWSRHPEKWINQQFSKLRFHFLKLTMVLLFSLNNLTRLIRTDNEANFPKLTSTSTGSRSTRRLEASLSLE